MAIISKDIQDAVKKLKNGEVIGFPTETVYGIGTLITNTTVLKEIYKIKGRAKEKPLQILISDINQINRLVKEIPKKARAIIQKHFPGSITLLLFKSDVVPASITRGSDKVGIRMPNHKLMLELLNICGPIAATSANKSGDTPAINAKEVSEKLPEIEFILDGGPCPIGISSTVADATEDPPKILRQGTIKLES